MIRGHLISVALGGAKGLAPGSNKTLTGTCVRCKCRSLRFLGVTHAGDYEMGSYLSEG